MLISWAGLLLLVGLVYLMLMKAFGSVNTVKSLLAYVNHIYSAKSLTWVGLGAAFGIALVFYLIVERVHYLFKPIPRKLYVRLNNIANAMPEVDSAMHEIAAIRDYVTRMEYARFNRWFKYAAKKQQKELNKVDRYPDGERLWGGLDYV